MRKVLKWMGIVLGVLIGLLILVVGLVYAISGYRFNKTYDIQVESVFVPNDAATISTGSTWLPSAPVWPVTVMTSLAGSSLKTRW